jgi:CRP-like cAMP-binding protein
MSISLHRSERIAALAEKRIARQREVVDRLAAGSLPTQRSIELLRTMESVLESLRRSHRLRLDQVFSQNRLLRALPPADFEKIEPALQPMSFERGAVIRRPGEPPHRVYFVERGVVSMVGELGGRRPEIAMVGREGAIGTEALVAGSSAFGYVALDDCEGIAISSVDLGQAAAGTQRLRDLLFKYTHTLQLQAGETAMSGGQPVLERLARWLLMYHDRIDGNEIAITHEAIAEMLSVRRAGVTESLHELEGRGLLKSMRARIRIKSRSGLAALAGGSYGIAAAAIGRLLPDEGGLVRPQPARA